MSQLTALKSAASLADVARILGIRPSGLSYILYVMDPDSKYTSFEVPKRYGGVRTICAPKPQLKLLQRRLANVLSNCLDEANNAADLKHTISHGFTRKRSILTNAGVHRNRRYVFNVDIDNFFGTINFGRVRGFFIKDHRFSLDPAVATIIAQIACHDNELPQGSPCSPVISNLIAHILDIHLVRLAAKSGCTYSRYADDLTFSTNKMDFPKAIACRTDQPHVWMPGHELDRIVRRSGFTINHSKTRMQYKASRQDVTGLVVNRKVNVRWEYRHSVRAMVHRLLTKGHFEVTRKWTCSTGAKREASTFGTLNQLHGMLGFIDQVDRYTRQAAPDNISGSSKSQLIYRRFLMFKEFYSAAMPTLICEGPTDTVYLVHAIRSLASKFPLLTRTSPDGTIRLGVRLFRYADTSTRRVLELTGGAPNLAKFVANYRREVTTFAAPGKLHPVVLIIDNDRGAKPVFAAVRAITGSHPTGDESLIHVTSNLYVVPIPKLQGKNETRIEDLFDPVTLNAEVDGKKLCLKQNLDDELHYGKRIFAHKVVRPAADTISFLGFSELLRNITSAIELHRTRFPVDSP